MSIQIPADVTIVTLRADGRELPQRWSDAHARAVFENAAALLVDRLGIEFRLASLERVVEEMPYGVSPIAVDTAGYHFLSAVHRAGDGVRVLMVDRLAQRELGGRSRHETRVCIVTFANDVAATGRKLAHEWGHLLEMGHVDDARREGPGNERLYAAWARNLMNSGVLNPAAEVTAPQRRQARGSAIARRFSRRGQRAE